MVVRQIQGDWGRVGPEEGEDPNVGFCVCAHTVRRCVCFGNGS